MLGLSNAALLDLCDKGRRGAPVERGLLLLAAALPGEDDATLAEFSIPQRDATVLAWRCAALGPGLPGFVDCPRCREGLEFDVDANALIASAPVAEAQAVRVGEWHFRLPNSSDLMATAAIDDAQRAARRLLQSCCLEGGADETWSDEWLAEVEATMSSHAGVSDIRFQLDCESCGYAWEAPFDICAYSWEEIERRAQALLDDVHRLALAYGWSESAILALSDARRAAYVARCDA
jgi:hypothetical protein